MKREPMTAADRFGGAASGHHLLPHERWFASFILERQRTHRTPAILRMEQNYGTEGIVLLSAGILAGLVGAIVVLTGFVALFLSDGHGTLLHAGYYLFLVGVVLELPAGLRAVQASVAGRRFRGNRPFVKRT